MTRAGALSQVQARYRRWFVDGILDEEIRLLVRHGLSDDEIVVRCQIGRARVRQLRGQARAAYPVAGDAA